MRHEEWEGEDWRDRYHPYDDSTFQLSDPGTMISLGFPGNIMVKNLLITWVSQETTELHDSDLLKIQDGKLNMTLGEHPQKELNPTEVNES
ncbi:hypothetical protein WISP_59435 [Willisornis vidua]|uniref:Uncharacterized protein n=1 Tax=Willisornis vidua TaxID=1566151 RepID=A0ABQ9DFI9_9PASS|nr:hypothetical protein WISP_59435 [Willisornis vidua]